MHTRAKALFKASLWIALSYPNVSGCGQEPQPSPSQPNEPNPNNDGGQTASLGFLNQEALTGDWGGARSQLKEKGVEFDFAFTQFLQAVASGGVNTGSVGNSKFQTAFKFDLGKLAGWKFWSVDVKTETRFGGPLLGGTGTISPVNTTAIIPGASGTVFAITSLNVTKLFPIDLQKGDLLAISFGRFNLLDLSDENFFGGGGIDRDAGNGKRIVGRLRPREGEHTRETEHEDESNALHGRPLGRSNYTGRLPA